jgi:threonine dehydrogenase-like Zn-dependent dehydrogenase
VSFEEGALVEPLSVAVHAVKRSGIGLAQTAAIFGAGTIGLLTIRLVTLCGAAGVYVVDLKSFRLQKARQMGASDVINACDDAPVEYIMSHTGGMGVDRAFEAVGSERTLTDCIRVLKQGGTGIVLGVFEEPEIRFPAQVMTGREISLMSSRAYCWDFQDAVKLLETGSIGLRELVTHRMGLADLSRAFELLLDPKSQALKVVICFD